MTGQELKQAPLFLTVALLLSFGLGGEERAFNLLSVHAADICQASRSFGISPRLLASVVFAERSLNVRPGEDLLDIVFARMGRNNSVGLAQVKVETAEWVQAQLHDRSSRFYLGAGFENVLPEASTREALLNQLACADTNLFYAAAYLAMIAKTWESALEMPGTETRKVGMVATLYSLGLDKSDGSFREPHLDAKLNHFGEVAQSFYDSFEMVAEVPR